MTRKTFTISAFAAAITGKTVNVGVGGSTPADPHGAGGYGEPVSRGNPLGRPDVRFVSAGAA